MPEGRPACQAKSCEPLKTRVRDHTSGDKLPARCGHHTARPLEKRCFLLNISGEDLKMNTIRYQPWRSLGDLQNEFSRLLDSPISRLQSDETTACDWVPAVDVREEDHRFVLHADLPGLDPKDIEITMEQGVLTIRGERKTESTSTDQGYRRVERATGQFYRRFTLPDTVDSEGVKAHGNNGVLEISIPKQARVQPRRIEVVATS